MTMCTSFHKFHCPFLWWQFPSIYFIIAIWWLLPLILTFVMNPKRGEDLLLGFLTQLCSSRERKAIRLGAAVPSFWQLILLLFTKSQIMHRSGTRYVKVVDFDKSDGDSTYISWAWAYVYIPDLKFAALLIVSIRCIHLTFFFLTHVTIYAPGGEPPGRAHVPARPPEHNGAPNATNFCCREPDDANHCHILCFEPAVAAVEQYPGHRRRVNDILWATDAVPLGLPAATDAATPA